jgi:nucleotide-binding universal stress UspA family protein
MTGGMLVAHDLGAPLTPVLQTAGDVAFRLGITLSVLHVVSDADVEAYQREQPEESGYLDVLLDRRRDALAERVTEALGVDQAREAELLVRRGEVAQVVVHELERGGFAFGAVGIRSRSRVGKLVFGSAVQSVLLLAPCPILTVPIE